MSFQSRHRDRLLVQTIRLVPGSEGCSRLETGRSLAPLIVPIGNLW